MEIDKLLVGFFSLGGIIFTYWFFLMKKEDIVAVTTDSVDIIVEGGYTPSIISIPKEKTTKISFTRKDPNSCLEEVVLGDFKIKKYLPLNKKITVEVTPKEKGEYGFACGMNMFHGKIIVN
jgi:plastocyanin domain-containing protein